MSIKSDYLLEMIARFCNEVLMGLDKAGVGDTDGAVESFEGVVGGVLDMDGPTVLGLSSSSLVTMMQLSAVDESLAVYCAYALYCASELYADEGDGLAEVRREQADAICSAYGFDPEVTPKELEEALAARGL